MDRFTWQEKEFLHKKKLLYWRGGIGRGKMVGKNYLAHGKNLFRKKKKDLTENIYIFGAFALQFQTLRLKVFFHFL